MLIQLCISMILGAAKSIISVTFQGIGEDTIDDLDTSPELLPVVMPDWVMEFLERKKKAKKEIEEAARRGTEKEIPIAVFIEDEDGEKKTIEEDELISFSNSVAKDLDWTGRQHFKSIS